MATGLMMVSAWAGTGFAEKPARPMGYEQVAGWPTNTFQSLEYGVELAIDGYASKIGNKNQSDIVLATAAFDLEGVLNDWLMGHAGLLWEDGSRETDNLDEAYVLLGASETVPVYLMAGRFYQPVGNFESVFINYPLTYSLAELNQTSAMLGYKNRWINLNAGAFKGDVKQGAAPGDGGDPTIDDFYASVSFSPVEQAVFGTYWLSDLMETYNLSRVGEQIANVPGYGKVGLAGLFANFHFGRFGFCAECISALGRYDFPSGSYAPMAFNLEGSVQISEKVLLGLKYEGSDDLYASVDRSGPLRFGDKLAGENYGAVVSYAFHQQASILVEYLHARELDEGKDGDMVTVELRLALK